MEIDEQSKKVKLWVRRKKTGLKLICSRCGQHVAAARIHELSWYRMESMRSFDSLSEREILSLAVALEEEDERIYGDFADGLRENYPATAEMFEGMRKEESGHRRRLIELHQARFGDHLPLIRRQDVKGFVNRKPVWLLRPLPLDIVRRQAAAMELETQNFYHKAAARATDAGIRQLLDDLALEERSHE